MATSVLQPEECRLEHEPKDIISRPSEDDRLLILEAKERESGDLPQELREKARVELREEPALRDQALDQIRHFIAKHPAIKKCRTGMIFFRFLFSTYKTIIYSNRFLNIIEYQESFIHSF